MRHLDLFSGIGGFAMAAEQVWGGKNENVGFCDNDPFCQAVLRKHWPESKIYDDIKNLHLVQGSADLITGGFPCQPFSQAGRRKGTHDDRHLWPEMLRVIRTVAPEWVVAENVRGLLTIDNGLVFEGVCADLEAIGYEVQPVVVPACAVGAPHRRDRIWIVAHARGTRRREKSGGASRDEGTHERRTAQDHHQSSGQGADATNNYSSGLEGCKERSSKRERAGHKRCDPWTENWTSAAARLCTLDDGVSSGLVRPRGWRNAAFKAVGNAIVPQVAMEIFRAMK